MSSPLLRAALALACGLLTACVSVPEQPSDLPEPGVVSPRAVQ